MPHVRWAKRISSRLGIVAAAFFGCAVLMGGVNLRAVEQFRFDVKTLVSLGRARRLDTECLYLAHRLYDDPKQDEVRAKLRSVIERMQHRYDDLDGVAGRFARAPLENAALSNELREQVQRFETQTRPELEQLLAIDDKETARPILDSLSQHVPLEMERLHQESTLALDESQASARWLENVEYAFFAFQAAIALALIGIARGLSMRARALMTSSARLSGQEPEELVSVEGHDEIAAIGHSLNSAVMNLRSFFDKEREALEARLSAVASMNSALAMGAPGMFLQAETAGHPGVLGSIPPSSLPPAERTSLMPDSVRPPHGPRRVLVVDDDPQVLRSFARILRAEHYETSSAASAAQAMEAVRNQTFDVIVSDIDMPGMDGIQLLRNVRERDLLVPVVLVTGKPALKSAAEAVELGAFQYLVKPVEKDAFRKVVEHARRMHEVARIRKQAADALGQETGLGADRAGLEAAWSRAIASLTMVYQPIVDIRAERVYGYEALLRSSEPSLPNPGAVLDAAERLGRLDELGRTVRARAAVPMLDQSDAVALFVNLHVRDLMDPTLLDPDAPLSKIASRVVLEITERASLEEVRDARHRATALREMGFRLAVDDMGAGYAGLSSFALLEPEIVKLDMSLVRDVHENATKRKVIRSMTTLAEDMGISIIAEGVESADERDTLIALGCNLLQGYFFAKPGKPFPSVSF